MAVNIRCCVNPILMLGGRILPCNEVGMMRNQREQTCELPLYPFHSRLCDESRCKPSLKSELSRLTVVQSNSELDRQPSSLIDTDIASVRTNEIGPMPEAAHQFMQLLIEIVRREKWNHIPAGRVSFSHQVFAQFQKERLSHLEVEVLLWKSLRYQNVYMCLNLIESSVPAQHKRCFRMRHC